ncbi:Acid-sensing ion channel 1B [Araneus ventricosus]|uniref:Acid-sensing ion channel 1B n=1 Tax=Araneus ventricosus TaxID=182803 RepID=A0A4Y2MMV7_ARAVE|nr:Acid-sensing ion channel 1B [Araneus ventricosus]
MDSPIYSVSRVLQGHPRFVKIFWLLVFLICMYGSLFKIQKLLSLYQQYSVVTSFHIDQERKLEFPAVSICNMNRIKEDECLEQFFPVSPLVFSSALSFRHCAEDQDNWSSGNERNKKALELLEKYYKMDERDRNQKDNSPFDFMVSCSFNGKNCSQNNLSHFVDFRYGSCITFNKNKGAGTLQTSKYGIDSGLDLTLNLDSRCYLLTSETVGAKIIIHDPDEDPNPEDEGFTTSPGYEVLISLKQNVIHRLESPYKDRCIHYKQNKKDFARSRNLCIRSCIQRYNFANCNCIDPTLTIKANLKSCSLTNETEICCLNDVLNDLILTKIICDCPLPCTSISYKREISKSVLSSKAFSRHPLAKQWPIVEKNKILFLNVFYSSFEKYTYRQHSKYEITELLSYIGNEFGLWLGLSFVALFDVIEKVAICVKIAYVNLFFRAVKETQ